jgi:hypothetical protein
MASFTPAAFRSRAADKKLRELMAMFYTQPVVCSPAFFRGSFMTLSQDQLRAFMSDLERQAGAK